MSDQPVVLVLRALGLGDFLTGLPALSVLRRALPVHHIVLAVPDVLAPLAMLAACVDETVHGHELEPLVHPPRRPELAVDLHGNGPQSRALLLDTAPERLIAFGTGGPRWRADEHEAARWCRLIFEGLPAPGIPVPTVVGALPVPPDVLVPAGATLVHCGAKAAARRWPAERMAAVANLLRCAGHEVLITAGPDEQELANSIAAASGTRNAGALDLPHLMALVARARLVISGDTGIAHVATNYRTPSVVLFGPVSPTVWGPPADPRHQVLWHGDGAGDPHSDQPDTALLRITVAEVIAACAHAVDHADSDLARGA
jgi:ADP-heptose:LPS heptosyltransferase